MTAGAASCTGRYDCSAAQHIHGCYAERHAHGDGCIYTFPDCDSEQGPIAEENPPRTVMVKEKPPRAGAWWVCPNDPPCAHGAVLHDREDDSDSSPLCVVEGCSCGSIGPEAP